MAEGPDCNVGIELSDLALKIPGRVLRALAFFEPLKFNVIWVLTNAYVGS